MLNHAIHDYGRQWHKAVPCLVWYLGRYQTVPPVYPPLFIVWACTEGAVVNTSWVLDGKRECDDDSSKSVHQYIQDLECVMQSARNYARIHANITLQKYTEQYNKHTTDKSFQVEQQAVVLQKDSTHKVFATWKQGT